jgi:hypothetical protein
MPGTLAVVTALAGHQARRDYELGEEGEMSTDAGGILDTTELAKRDVAQSRHIAASAAQDLKRHQQWLKSYIASEKRSRDRHVRSLEREQARQRRRLKRQNVARLARWTCLGLAISVRSISRSLLHSAISTLAYLRNPILVTASWIASTTYALAASLLRLLSIGFSRVWANGRALAVALLRAASISFAWVAVRIRALALASLRGALVGALWVAARTRDLAIASGKATSVGRTFALASRDAASVAFAWTAARTGTLARATSEAASIGLSWTQAKGHTSALASQEAALIGCTWIAAKSRACARASLSAASTGSTWMRATWGDLALKLSYAGSMTSPWIRTTAHGAMSRLLTLGAAARVTARHQSERAALLALKLNMQVKAEIDALRRAAGAGKLTPAAWRKLAAIASPRKGVVRGFAMEEGPTESKAAGTESEGGDATIRNGHHASRNALICVEPWRSRLPVVQTGAREIRTWQFRSKATDRRHVGK